MLRISRITGFLLAALFCAGGAAQSARCEEPPASRLFAAANGQVAGASASPLGPNLFTMGDFEEWEKSGEPAGWTVELEKGTCGPSEEARATGKHSLKLQISAKGGVAAVTSPEMEAGPGCYLVRFMYRVEGLSRSNQYEGGQADLQIHWINERGAVIRRDYVAWTYFPIELTYRDQLIQAPDDTAGYRVIVGIHGDEKIAVPSVAWFDDVAVCRYKPPQGIGEKVVREWSATAGREVLKTPEAASWFYLSGVEGNECVQAARERDPNALLGQCLHAKPDALEGMVYHSPYTIEQPPGLYRAFFRLRVPRHPPEKTDAPLVNLDVISSGMGTRAARIVRFADFKKPGEYEDLAVDFVKPFTEWIALRVYAPGKGAESWLDCVRVVQLLRFKDADLFAWYPGLAGSLGDDAALERKGPPQVLLVEGLIGNQYRLREAVQTQKDHPSPPLEGGRQGDSAPNWQATVVQCNLGQAGSSLPQYPARWKDLRTYGVVVLANASVEGIGPGQRYQLRRFVENGGGLLVLGGKSSYGNGGIRGSFLEDVLPVQVAESRFDISTGRKKLELEKAGEQLGLGLAADLACCFLHGVTIRKGASILIKADSAPFLVTGIFGKGRVACLLGTPYGRGEDGQIHFADWKEFPKLISQILGWLASSK